MVYRDEQSGELGGLTRVLSITQDDAHVFCRTTQVREEFLKIWDIVDTFYKKFGFSLRVRLSFRDPAAPEKYIGTPEVWDRAENELRSLAEERGADTFEGPGEAALYGPKLDFMAKNAAGREWQVATIQLDMNIPERFDLTCVNEKGEKERIVMIHAAIAGSLERCAAVLLVHFEGVLPLWLSPVQVSVLPVGEAHQAYAEEVAAELKKNGIRAELLKNDSLGKRIRETKTNKVPCFIVVGDKEVTDNTITVENNRSGDKQTVSLEDFITPTLERIKERANI
jgi:threonyl-tRNA synthetase